ERGLGRAALALALALAFVPGLARRAAVAFARGRPVDLGTGARAAPGREQGRQRRVRLLRRGDARAACGDQPGLPSAADDDAVLVAAVTRRLVLEQEEVDRRDARVAGEVLLRDLPQVLSLRLLADHGNVLVVDVLR